MDAQNQRRKASARLMGTIEFLLLSSLCVAAVIALGGRSAEILGRLQDRD